MAQVYFNEIEYSGPLYSGMQIEDGKVRKEAGYTTDLWTRNGIKFIEQNKDRPFFLAVGLVRPHLRWIAPARWTMRAKSVSTRTTWPPS